MQRESACKRGCDKTPSLSNAGLGGKKEIECRPGRLAHDTRTHDPGRHFHICVCRNGRHMSIVETLNRRASVGTAWQVYPMSPTDQTYHCLDTCCWEIFEYV